MRVPGLKPVRERNPIAVALVGLLVLALGGFAAYRADALPGVGGGTSYTAHFSEAAGLRSGDEVRVAGVKVGEVDGVGLDGPRVAVDFTVRDAWIGDRSTAAIAIETLLGEKYLAVDPLGSVRQDADQPIPVERTTSPYDVTQAFQDLSSTVGELDTTALAESFEVISETFEDTPPHVRKAANGLADLSQTISSRDAELARLLSGSDEITKTLKDQNDTFETLLKDGNDLLAEVRARRDAIHALFTGTRDLAKELDGLVEENEEQIGPVLDALDRVTGVLRANEKNLDKALATAGPYYRLVGNTLGSGRWFDSYLCGLVPREYAPDVVPDRGCRPPEPKGGR
ncbi:ABC transporter substrate-binding protein [Streptomyces sp. WAC 06738]|uniref:MCE family protein n=1 Tax=Streptomyces sp. WAC 06738 TaxID=2203210 RepID=UPI000F6F5275|nr:MCE family protein [Streptomyces sp. WAC 06738]AZM46533.1 ABC transporter substrate-binding protein [Streptomyces sp. WAC 06738]